MRSCGLREITRPHHSVDWLAVCGRDNPRRVHKLVGKLLAGSHGPPVNDGRANLSSTALFQALMALAANAVFMASIFSLLSNSMSQLRAGGMSAQGRAEQVNIWATGQNQVWPSSRMGRMMTRPGFSSILVDTELPLSQIMCQRCSTRLAVTPPGWRSSCAAGRCAYERRRHSRGRSVEA